jgi:hypothetical protein
MLLAGMSACQSSTGESSAPTAIPFPTVTMGYTLHGVLSTPGGVSDVAVSNPATVEALANQPTVTPDTGSCPALSENADLSSLPEDSDAIAHELLRFLSAGGTAVILEDALRNDWGILGELGFVRSDIDLTGDGVPEVILGYVVPGAGSTLLVAGCEGGRYVLRHQAVYDSETAPQLILLGDTNHDGLNNIVFVVQRCDDDDECLYQTHLITWQPQEWRFVGLLGTPIESDALPEMMDMDGDDVSEIVIRMERWGSWATGPLRTGVMIYDWDGSVYVLSIPQLNPPRFRIQYIHAADRRFESGDMDGAINLYQNAITDEGLGVWRDNETPILESYILYRMILTRVANNDGEAESVYQYIVDTYLDPAQAPVYVEMSRVFWESYQATSDLSAACQVVQEFIGEHPDVLSLMNRYGSRTRSYTAEDMCPF